MCDSFMLVAVSLFLHICCEPLHLEISHYKYQVPQINRTPGQLVTIRVDRTYHITYSSVLHKGNASKGEGGVSCS